MLAALSCCGEAHAALVVVEGSDLLRFGSDAAGGLGLTAGGVGAVLNRCAEAVDASEGLSGVSLEDGGSTVHSFWADGLVVLCEGDGWGDWNCLLGAGPASGTSGVPPLEGLCSFGLLSPDELSLTGPRTLLATVASWDTTFSTPLSRAGTGEELAEGAVRLAAAAAHSLRLSASFFSLGMPGEEQEPRGDSWLSVVLLSVVLLLLESGVLVPWRSVVLPKLGLMIVLPLGSVVPSSLESVVLVFVGSVVLPPLKSVVLLLLGSVRVVLEGTLVLWTSGPHSGSVVFPLKTLESCGGVGFRKVSLLTEMNALPGVEKGFVVPLGPRTFLSCPAPSSVDEAS